MNHDTVLTIFVAVTAVAFCLQLVILFLLYKSIEKSSERMENTVNRLEQRLAPVLTTANTMLEEVQPRISEITSNLAQATATIRSHVEVVADATGEIVERARLQAARIDHMIHSTADKVEQTTDFLQSSVVTPVRRIHAVVQALSAGLKFFKQSRRSRKAAELTEEEDEEMFI